MGEESETYRYLIQTKEMKVENKKMAFYFCHLGFHSMFYLPNLPDPRPTNRRFVSLQFKFISKQ